MTQHYIGTKQVKAQAMTRQEYNDYRGWTLPADENGADEGYLVEYTDGGAPNHKDHAGYISWSPKEQFEAAYLPTGHIGHLYPHEQRVVGELVQLTSAREKLGAFIETNDFTYVPEDQQILLRLQYDVQGVLSDILDRHIKSFQRVLPEYLKGDQGLEPVEYFDNSDIAKLTVPEREGMFGYNPLPDRKKVAKYVLDEEGTLVGEDLAFNGLIEFDCGPPSEHLMHFSPEIQAKYPTPELMRGRALELLESIAQEVIEGKRP